MKLKYLLLSCFSGFVFGQNTYQTPYEKGNGNQSATYDGMNSFYQDLSKNFKSIQYLPKGEDDNGKPIYVVIFNPFKEKIEKLGKDKTILMINNGIHPGEPDGIDATMMLMRDLATQKVKAPENIVIAAISAYNVSGMLNRGSYSRANQNGPEEYGFRGNTRNYDLNRDFIKADTKNARSFQQIYQWLNPDVFIDNHVSNGADYQYTFTYISTHKERLGNTLGDYFFNNFQAQNLKQMETLGYESTPYVNIHGDVPETGFAAFEDSPRYATGYTSLFNSIGTVVETHMLKPYDKRVDATYKYMLVNLENIDRNYKKIKELRKENLKQYEAGKPYAIRWKVDSTQFSTMNFKGFETGYKPSAISGQKRLYYDRNKPFTKQIKLFNTYKPTGFVTIPRYYVIPQSEYLVIEELKRNNIRINVLKKDSVASVEAYKINDFKTVKNPYEGHYIHYETVVGKSKKQIRFSAGDYVVPTQQQGVKYIVETLEPEGLDSFFNWNFFDGILGQKEYYSAYIFEDTAADLMKNDTALRTAFEAKKKIDKDFAKDGKAQLDWVYQNSRYYEAKTYRQYPVYRIL